MDRSRPLHSAAAGYFLTTTDLASSSCQARLNGSLLAIAAETTPSGNTTVTVKKTRYRIRTAPMPSDWPVAAWATHKPRVF